MTRRLLVLVALGGLLVAGVRVAAPAEAMPLDAVVATIRDAGGHYQRGAATLTAADCSGLVSVAQSLAMGQEPRRLGNTHSLLAGSWPHAIPGATPDDVFIIGASRSHMSAQIDGVRVEATCCGRPFKVGPSARDPFTYPHVFLRRRGGAGVTASCICGCPSSAHVNGVCRTRRYSPDGPHMGGGGRYWLCECGGYVAEPSDAEGA